MSWAGRTYDQWREMHRRCEDPQNPSFHLYVGTKIDPRWNRWEGGTYAAFREDMGDCPPGHTLDRIDLDGDFTPENSYWAEKGVVARRGQRQRQREPASLPGYEDAVARRAYRSRGARSD